LTDSRTRSNARLIAVATIAAATIALVATSAQAAAPRSFFGVVPQTNLNTADIDRMGQGRVGTLRVPLFWSTVDPSAAAGDESYAGFDAIVRDSARNGIEVLPFLFGTPEWVARDLDGRSCSAEKCTVSAPSSGPALDAWRTFVGATVARYGPNGTFWTENPDVPKVPITAWQVWNEQNSSEFFKPKPKPKSYGKLLEAAASAIRAEDASADVVLGGMAELAGSKKATEGSKYLAKLYKVKGAKKNFDGVAPHPYGAQLGKVIDQINGYRKLMKKAGDKKASMWVTEIGWGSAKGGNPLNRGTQGQAQRLKEAFKYLQKKRNKLNLETVTWFSWMDSTTSICDWCAKSGLFKAGLVEKPAWRAFTKFTGGS
jgi:hypothetical protein